MGHQHHRHALAVQLGQQRHHVVAGFAVERSGGLVGQDQRGLVHQGPRNRHPLLLPARELVGRVVGARAQAHPPQRGQRTRAPLGRLDAGIDHGQFHVFQRAGAWQQVELLEHKANLAVAQPRQRVGAHVVHRLTGQAVFARGGCVQAAQDVHERAFAGPRGAHDGHKVAGLNLQRHPIQGLHRLVAQGVGFHQIANLDQRHAASAQNGGRGPAGR